MNEGAVKSLRRITPWFCSTEMAKSFLFFFSFRFYLFVKINTRAFLEVIKRYPGKSIRYHLQIFRTPDISHQCSFHYKVEKIGISRYNLLNLSWKRFCTVLRKKCINILLSLGCARFLSTEKPCPEFFSIPLFTHRHTLSYKHTHKLHLNAH